MSPKVTSTNLSQELTRGETPPQQRQAEEDTGSRREEIPHTSKTKGDPRRTERQARLQLVRVSRETTPRRGWNRCVWAYGGEMDSAGGETLRLNTQTIEKTRWKNKTTLKPKENSHADKKMGCSSLPAQLRRVCAPLQHRSAGRR